MFRSSKALIYQMRNYQDTSPSQDSPTSYAKKPFLLLYTRLIPYVSG